MNLGLRGRHAVVCGGGRGIGYAAAESLAREGVHLTLVARTQGELERAAAKLQAATGVEVDFVACDLADRSQRRRLLDERPWTDVLLANPGVPQRSIPYQALNHTEMDAWMEAHFYSAIELIRHYLPGMMARRFGRVVNLTVNFIKFPQSRVGHSHAARLALAGAIASLVREAAPHNVSLNSLLAGLVDTSALRSALAGRAEARGVTYDVIAAETAKACPAGRIADPAEIGDLVAMLAAAQSGFVTGQNIVADGGAYTGLF